MLVVNFVTYFPRNGVIIQFVRRIETLSGSGAFNVVVVVIATAAQ